ncbi:MAG TPA: glycosyltransferase family 4 protein [Kofleriaceae bacterium]|nr:glycosyltransferase family 4 protein [Kofleriaceae bacterium]
MKVLLVNKFFFRNGGSETVFFDERQFLIDSGVSVCDFSMKDERNLPTDFGEFFVSNTSYRGDTLRPLASLSAAIALVHSFEAVAKFGLLLESERPDIVHCHNIYHQLTPSIIHVAKSRGIPVVLTLHDYKTVCPTYLRLRHGELCSACLDGSFINVLRNRCAGGSVAKSALLYAEAMVHKMARTYERADVVIAPSQFLADAVASRFDPSRVRVLPNGIDISRTKPSGRDGGFVVFFGRVAIEKGIRTLLRAFRAFAGCAPLKICGDGPLLSALQSSDSGVEFLGHRSGDDLTRIVRDASVVVVPSECYENCPMSVLEAMGHGKPVVASRIGGIPELVIDGETGLLFEPGNAQQLAEAVLGLMSNPEQRLALGRAGRQRLEERFSLERHNRDLLRVYHAVTKGRSARN